MSTSSTPQTQRLSDLATARLTAALGLLFAALTAVSHGPDVLLAAAATGLALLASVMLMHRHSTAAD